MRRTTGPSFEAFCFHTIGQDVARVLYIYMYILTQTHTFVWCSCFCRSSFLLHSFHSEALPTFL